MPENSGTMIDSMRLLAKLTIGSAMLPIISSLGGGELLKIGEDESKELAVSRGQVLRLFAWTHTGSTTNSFEVTVPGRFTNAPLQIPAGALGRPIVLAGPFSIRFPTGVRQIAFVQLETNALFHTAFRAESETAHVVVPDGYFFQLYDTLPVANTNRLLGTQGRRNQSFRVLIEGESYELPLIEPGFVVPGPITMSIPPSGISSTIYSATYTISEGGRPGLESSISTPPGRSTIQVEASTDLRTWFPIFFHESESDQERFFRIRAGQ